jgi:hypothetical protein
VKPRDGGLGSAPLERVPPYSTSLARSIRKDRRVYFFDCAAAYDATGGAQLENLVACSLLKFAQFRKDAYGESWAPAAVERPEAETEGVAHLTPRRPRR